MGFVGTATSAAIGWLKHATAAGSTLLNDLVSYWTLDEQSGTRADSVGSNDLTDNNTVLAVNRGPVGTVASFVKENSEFLDCSGFPVTNEADWTVVAWHYGPCSTATEYAFDAYKDNSHVVWFGAWVDGKFHMEIYDGGESYSSADAPNASTNEWRMVAGGYDSTQKKSWVSVNGGTRGYGAALPAHPDFSSYSYMAIGRERTTYSTHNQASTGLWIGNVSDETLLSLFNSGNGKKYADLTAAEKVGLVSYWDLSEVSGTRVDAHGDNDLTDNNTVGSVNTGPLGTVASFVTANSESLSTTALSIALSDASDGFSVSVWGKEASDRMRVTFSGTNSLDGWIMDTQGNGNVASNLVTASGRADHAVGASIGTILPYWNHFVYTYTPSDRKVRLYINGTLATGTPTTNITAGQTQTLTNMTFGGPAAFFTGTMGGAGLWSKALSADEAIALFNSGLGKRYADLTAAEKVGLVSYWNLDEASGTRVDAHGANDLTDNNTVLSVINAPPALDGAAASFVAANSEYLSASVAAPDLSLGFTIAGWVYPKADETFVSAWYLVDGSEYYIKLYADGGAPTQWYARFYGGANDSYATATGITSGTWYHVVMWYDPADKKAKISFNNGTPFAGSAAADHPALSGTTTLTFASGNTGARTMLLDEPAIWSRVLTADERAELYAAGAGKFYPFS